MLQNCKHCITTVFRFFFNNHNNRSLTKVWTKNFAKELLRTITVTVPLVHPDYWPLLLSQEKLKNPKFSQQKVAVFTRNRTNKQLWQKSQFRFYCKNTTFCEHHKYKQSLGRIFSKMIQQIDHFPLKDFAGTPNWLNFVSKKHLSGVVSNLEPIPQCYGFMSTPCRSSLKPRKKNENKIAYEYKTKRKLKQSNI